MFFNEMFAAANPSQRGREVTVREVMDDAASHVGERFADKPLVEARIRHTIAQTYVGLGEYTKALEQARPALDIFERRKGPPHPQTLDARISLGEIIYFLGRTDASLTLFTRLHDDIRAVQDPDPTRPMMPALSLIVI